MRTRAASRQMFNAIRHLMRFEAAAANYAIATRNGRRGHMILKLNETNRNKTLSKYCAEMHTSEATVASDTHIHMWTCTCVVGTRQVRIFITTTSGENYRKKKRRAGLDLNVSGTREIAAATRITVLSPSMATRWTVDRCFGSKRSKNLENVARRRDCWI